MDTNDSAFRYEAFISYRHQPLDQRWADWLINALETYRPPRAIAARLRDAARPSRITKVFRDVDEAGAGGELGAKIRDALKKSRCLIVICSRATPGSRWVPAEIRYFASIGRTEHILPLLIEGEPQESFPAALHEVINAAIEDHAPGQTADILAADGRLRGNLSLRAIRHRVLLKLVAGALEVEYDDLYRRDRRRRRGKVGLAACAAALALGGAAWRWDSTRIKHFDYADTVTRWSIPTGLRPISAATAHQRNVYFQLEERGHQVLRVLRVNGSGQKRDNTEGISEWTMKYFTDGSLEGVEERNHNGILVRSRRYAFKEGGTVATVKFNGEDRMQSQTSTEVSTQAPTTSHPTITYNRNHYSPEGWAVNVHYEDGFGQPRQDAQGIYGWSATFSDRGQPLVRTPLNAKGQPLTLKSGVARYVYRYDGDGNVVEEHAETPDGSPIRNPYNGCVWLVQRFSPVGNRIEEACQDAQRRLVSSKWLWARAVSRYDAQGNRIDLAFFGTDGKPVSHSGYFFLVKEGYDRRGNETRLEYFGIRGERTTEKNGVVGSMSTYDALGNLLWQRLFGLDVAAVTNKDGIAGWTQRYDARGALIELAYFGKDGRPALSKDGYARIRMEQFGVDGKPIAPNGYWDWNSEFDERGYEIKASYFGVDGKPALSTDGYAGWTSEFDAWGNETRVRRFGVRGEPVLGKDGYAGWDSRYDERFQEVERIYLGTDGKPRAWKSGYARWTRTFDANGALLTRTFWSPEGKRVRPLRGHETDAMPGASE